MNKIIFPNFSATDYDYSSSTIYNKILNKAKQDIIDEEDKYIIGMMNNIFVHTIYDWEFSEYE